MHPVIQLLLCLTWLPNRCSTTLKFDSVELWCCRTSVYCPQDSKTQYSSTLNPLPVVGRQNSYINLDRPAEVLIARSHSAEEQNSCVNVGRSAAEVPIPRCGSDTTRRVDNQGYEVPFEPRRGDIPVYDYEQSLWQGRLGTLSPRIILMTP